MVIFFGDPLSNPFKKVSEATLFPASKAPSSLLNFCGKTIDGLTA